MSSPSTPVGTLAANLQSAQIWPIKAQGQVSRINPLGDPDIAEYYNNAMEQGRFLESSIADANTQLIEKKLQIQAQIATYFSINGLAVDGQSSNPVRAVLYAADSAKLLKQVGTFIRNSEQVVTLALQNIQTILVIEASMLQMIQANLNSIANLLNNICNWGLPALPSIPDLLADGIWNWNGFNFAPLEFFAKSLANNTNFSFNFSFSQCNLVPPAPETFITNPSSVTSYSGNTYGTQQFVPPLNGVAVPSGQPLTDPGFIAQMQATTTTPYYSDFNPNSSMEGSLPNPSTIVSNYQLPSATYESNIVSIVLSQDVVEPNDSDYTNPNLTVRDANLRRDLVDAVTLGQVVASNYNPNLMAAWLFYLNITRNFSATSDAGRGGVWIPNFQAAFVQFIQPSITSLASNPIPWNNVLGGTGVSNAPADIPLTDTILAATGFAQANILWKLSYIEAALLGYTRNKTWDPTGADGVYLSGFTGSDLDYQPTTIVTTNTSTTTLGVGTASFPVGCTYPTAIKTVFDEVVALATQNIANNTGYQTPYVRFKYVYNQFAEATLVDRYTQFWRTFNYNLQLLLAQDPYLIQFVVTYAGALDSAIDPLGSSTDYNILQQDVATRNRSWTPGNPLLTIPIAPIVTFSNGSTPTAASNGWTNPPYALDPNSFLSRPDIQGQPIPTQIAMLRTNLSYAGLNTFQNQMQTSIATLVANTQSVIAQAQQMGFDVQASVDTTSVPIGPTGAPVAFDQTVFDYTGNVTNPTTFTIQASGTYAISGQLDWDSGAAGVRAVTIYQNGTAVYTTATPASQTGPTTLQFATSVNVNVGDVFQVFASHNLSTPQNVLPGSELMMLQTASTTTPAPVVPAASTTQTFMADVGFPVLTVVSVQPDGGVIPINPVIPSITSVQIATNVLSITADNGFTSGQYVTFANLGNATFLNGVTVQIATANATGFTATYSHTNYGPTAETQGQALLAIDATGVIAVPNPDGVALGAGVQGSNVTVGTTYGGIYQVSGADFTVGGLIYVAADGTLTQNFDSLLTTVGWVMVVGRAITTDTFIYEPHIPTRYLAFS